MNITKIENRSSDFFVEGNHARMSGRRVAKECHISHVSVQKWIGNLEDKYIAETLASKGFDGGNLKNLVTKLAMSTKVSKEVREHNVQLLSNMASVGFQVAIDKLAGIEPTLPALPQDNQALLSGIGDLLEQKLEQKLEEKIEPLKNELTVLRPLAKVGFQTEVVGKKSQGWRSKLEAMFEKYEVKDCDFDIDEYIPIYAYLYEVMEWKWIMNCKSDLGKSLHVVYYSDYWEEIPHGYVRVQGRRRKVALVHKDRIGYIVEITRSYGMRKGYIPTIAKLGA